MFNTFKMCEILVVIRFLNVRIVKPAEIYSEVKGVYGENAITDAKVGK